MNVPFNKKLSVNMPSVIAEAVRRAAALQNLSIADFARQALIERTVCAGVACPSLPPISSPATAKALARSGLRVSARPVAHDANRRAIVHLPAPLRTTEGDPVHRIVLREPTAAEVLEISGPYIVATAPGGVKIRVENAVAIAALIRRCVVEPTDQSILSQAGASVARACKIELLKFFSEDPHA